jgi:hypothetical protein
MGVGTASVGVLSPSAGVTGGTLVGVLFVGTAIVKLSVTGCVDCLACPSPRTKEMSTCSVSSVIEG